MPYEDGHISVRPTIRNCNGESFTRKYRSNTKNLMIPDNLSQKELDKYVKERSSEVITYNIKDLEKDVVSDYGLF